MGFISNWLATERARRVERTALQGVIGGVIAYVGAQAFDTSLLADVAWWKGALAAGAIAGAGSLIHNYVPGLSKLLPPSTPPAK
jgi:hypothetical protein